MRRFAIIIILLFFSFTVFTRHSYGRSLWNRGENPRAGIKTVENVLNQLGPKIDSHLKPFFDRVGVEYPPSQITLIGLKEEMKLELWAAKGDTWVHVRTYDVFAASGVQGPKQKQGDRQVPEGIYQITALNPNSNYHLSMKLNYPNSYDLEMARNDRRSNLGGDIYIHGNAKSIGCLAIGNAAIEELFVLIAKMGTANVTVLLAPYDLRSGNPNVYLRSDPAWLPTLYANLVQEMEKFRLQDLHNRSFEESKR